MVIYMVYDIQTADLAPESHRSSMVYSSYGYSYRKSDRSNSNTGMSYRAVNAILRNFREQNLSPIWDLPILDIVGNRPRGECAVRFVRWI